MNAVSRDRAVLAGVIFVSLLAQVLLYPGVPDLVEALGASTDLDPSMWFLAAEFAAFICFAGVWGVLSDRANRRLPFIAAGAGIAAASYVALAGLGALTSIGFTAVLAVRVLQGAGVIGAFSLAITMLMDLEGGHGRNMGAAGIAIGSGTALGAPLGGAISGVNPLAPLVAAGGLFLAILPLLHFVRDRAPSDRATVRGVLTDLRAHPGLGLPFAFGYVDRLTAGTFSLVGVFFLGDRFGLDPAAIGLVLMLFFAPFALLQYPFGMLTDRVGRFLPVVGGSIGYGVVIVLVGQASTLGIAGATLLAVGICGALLTPATMALVTDITPETRRATAMAGYNVAGSLGFLTGILLGGFVASTRGFAAAFAVVGGLEILIALVGIHWFRRLAPTIGPMAGLPWR